MARLPRIDDVATRLEVRKHIDPATGCWVWTGRLDAQGYGITSAGGRPVLVHRLSYERVHGKPELPALDHLCRNRACFNPEHLEPVTHRENMLRSPIAPGALNAAKTHCAEGHEYTPDNTRIYRHPTKSYTARRCVTCSRKWARESAARKRVSA